MYWARLSDRQRHADEGLRLALDARRLDRALHGDLGELE